MQFSLEKRLEKENGFITLLANPSYQSMGCVINWGNRFINSTRNFFICLKMFIMEQRKHRAEMREKEWEASYLPSLAKTGSFSYA